MAIVNSMSENIATEVGQDMVLTMQQVLQGGHAQVGCMGARDDVMPHTTKQHVMLLEFHGAMNVSYLKQVWRLFKAPKTSNYNLLHRTIRGLMIQWADNYHFWIKEGVYFNKKTIAQ
jgi:hypothetical protein